MMLENLVMLAFVAVLMFCVAFGGPNGRRPHSGICDLYPLWDEKGIFGSFTS